MTKPACKAINVTEMSVEKISFGVADSKGRILGITICTSECDMIPYDMSGTGGCYHHANPGHNFIARVYANKDGVQWGASQPCNYFDSAEERDAYIAKRVEAARKKAVK